jgi:phosphoenolpyruvate carboxykinase (GTP)
MRVLKWMLERVEGKAEGVEHAVGISPRYEDLSWSGLEFSRDQFDSVISIDRQAWAEELELHGELFEQLAYHLPEELRQTKTQIAQRLAHGSA